MILRYRWRHMLHGESIQRCLVKISTGKSPTRSWYPIYLGATLVVLYTQMRV